MKKILFLMLMLLAAVSLYGKPKYVFLFIGDGMAMPQRMVAEDFSRSTGKGCLEINNFPYHGTTRTKSAGDLITDSAAAATAIACGEKTKNGRLGISADGKRKLESVAKVAKRNGKKVGIITSVTINHATPGGFYANRMSRGEYYEIGLDLIASGFDYFGGGAVAKPDDKKSPLYRGNIYTLAQKAGYTVVSDRAGLMALKPGGKVLARGTDGYLPGYIDRKYYPEVPTLADFTAKGIELLDNPNGFFMMVESGAIDLAGHANEAATNLFEVLALDEAVKVALKFAEKHPDETLIVVTGDHETGGMTMGFAGSGYTMHVERLALQKCSLGQFKTFVKNAKKEAGKSGKSFTFDDAKKLLNQYFSFEFSGNSPMRVSGADEELLKSYFQQGKLEVGARIVMSRKAGIGWTSGGHTAMPVSTTSYGAGAKMFTGFYENTDIAKKLKSVL